MKNLVIVESPTKARTISRFLGKDYDIKFSMGHLVDLPKSTLGVKIDHDFQPELEIVADKKSIIADLKSAAKSADMIILATDPDREGEAIASHIHDILGTGKAKTEKFRRIVFHEITEHAIKDALSHPRAIDENLVSAQTARRVLDRLVGYKISPVLWQKVRRGLSAGRVQSVALRLIVEREREIEKFSKSVYFTIHADLKKKNGEKTSIPFDLVEINGEKLEETEKFSLYDGEYKVTKTIITDEDNAARIVAGLKEQDLVVGDVLERQSKRSPQPPFTTSTLQQEASRRYGYPGKRTMSLAQKLYEEGFITYHRTDSVVLSSSAVGAIRSFIKNEFGDKYVPDTPRSYTTKQKLAQEAHEGIRPTRFDKSGSGQHEAVSSTLGKECSRLYEMIFNRAVASQMADAIVESTTVYADSKPDTQKEKFRLKANGSVLVFEGFLKINPQALQDTKLPKFTAGDDLEQSNTKADRHETPAPPRYNDASLIGALEEKGIGRPSTYASIIATLTDRAYIERVERRFVPTSVGMAVNDFLVENFSTIDDIPFTAQMEDDLDEVANGKKEWVAMMKEFYKPFEEQLKGVKDAARVKIAAEEVDEKCEICGSNLLIRVGRFGKFLACSKFPECKFTKPFVEKTDILCPKDGGKVIIKKTRKGRRFYGCSNYPACTFAAWKLEDIKNATPQEKQNTSEEATTPTAL